jgi:hypothetical protein
MRACMHVCKKQVSRSLGSSNGPNESSIFLCFALDLYPFSLGTNTYIMGPPPPSRVHLCQCQKRRASMSKFLLYGRSSNESRVSRSHEQMKCVCAPGPRLQVGSTISSGKGRECTSRYLAVVLSDGITIKSRLSFRIFPHSRPNMMVVRRLLSPRDYANSICSFSGFQRYAFAFLIVLYQLST